VRSGKERNLYLNGGEIPVHLVYDAGDHETEAVVKEVSSDSLLKKTMGDKTRESRSKKFDSLSDSKNNEKSKKISTSEDVKPSNIEKELSSIDDPILLNSPSIEYIDAINEKIGFMPRSLSEETLDTKKIKRKIQHYQTVYQPNIVFLNPMLASPSQFMSQNHAESDGEKRQTIYSTTSLTSGLPYQAQFPSIQGYLPVSSNSPYNNAMWTAVTNIVEYSEGEDCKKEHVKSRRKRDASSRNGRENSGPQIMRLKVRKGGVAIAGPGGIATAGAGGTAIVGPGGTAYASPSGTAIVGPGGKVIQLPGFEGYEGGTPVVRARNSKTPEMDFKVVASGPVVYVGPKTTTVERL
jgi:hypothetical protein